MLYLFSFILRRRLVYFKGIELAGFKSFADRTEIKFESGLTAIVGPNGCGKSNVGDAIRWVLGEQSSKQLRGSSMQDVIFNGTKKRKSLSYCEATLLFNNTDRFFDYDYDELAVTRKLYRSGESEYLINKQPCRLKDIINLFYDSGVGRDGYSIIGQGKVEEIISSKPESRRLIFEEAAGIAKFKSRKVEAERKLERTRDNLTRLRDILGELEKQLGPLKKQAETARKYLELKGQLKVLEVNAYIYQYENASDIKDKINTKLSAICEQLALRESEYEKVNFEYEKNMQNINNIDKTISSLHERILNLTVALEKQAGESKLLRERINFLNEQNDKIELDITNSKIYLEKSKENLQSKEKKIAELEQDLKGLNQASQEIFTEYLTIVQELELCEGEQQQQTQSILDNMDKLTDIKSTYSRFVAEGEMLDSNKVELLQQLKSIDLKISEINEQIEKATSACDRANSQSKEYQQQQAKQQFRLASINSEIKEQQEQRNNMYARLQVYENRKRLLSEMQAEYEGYAHSVKKLLKESEKNANLKSKMLGVLASLIKVPVKYETAIEVALGNALQNIVTYDENNAKDLIRFLKENQYGRATFLPVSTMKPRSISAQDYAQTKVSGCFGVASTLIDFDLKIANVIENLLGATVIVDTLDTAIKLANNTRFNFKIVTLDGDVINPTGSLTGGSRKNESANLIAREREIETLAKEIEKGKVLFADIEKNLKNLTTESSELAKEIESSALLKAQADILSAKENEKMQAVEQTLNSVLQEKMAVQSKLNAISNKLQSLAGDIDQAKKMEQGATVQDFSATNAQRQERTNQLKAKKEEYTNNLTSIKVKIASIEKEIEVSKDEVLRLSEDIASEEVILSSNEGQLERNKATVAEAEKMLAAEIEVTTSEKSRNELADAKEKQENLASSKEKMQDAVKVLNDQKTSIIDIITDLKEKKYHEEAQLAKVDTDIEGMKERIYEEYELDYDGCLEFRQSEFDFNFSITEINRLKREINKLGYVNVNAIEDSKIVLERYENMDAQAQDLIKAEEDLVTIIKDLSLEMETKFKTQFEKINENFKITFRELFGGGSACLELLDSENILESGVDIVAEPPGKSLKNITLLSGGEKALTAIAILFAILKLKPMPFCLLDEIEAALDEANVERFAQYIKRFSNSTQFIVVTHRKPTMELADSLYGVTMEEEGVSRIVSVKLSDAIKDSKENQAS